MKVVLNINDYKAPFIMELLNDFKHVKPESELSEKEILIEEIKQAAKDIELYKKGKLKLKSLREALDEI